MKLKRPSAAMIVGLIALVMSMTGGAIAAVNFAHNSDRVDGFDAIKASKAGKKKAAGKLLATYGKGSDNRGQFPLRAVAGAASDNDLQDLADAAAEGRNGVRSIPVADNQPTAADSMVDLGLGSLQVSCTDQNDNAGTENAATRVSITNSSGSPVNLSRQVGNGAPTITTLGNGIVSTFTVGQQNTFTVQLQGSSDRTVVVDGTALQVGQGTADSSCVVWATALLVD